MRFARLAVLTPLLVSCGAADPHLGEVAAATQTPLCPAGFYVCDVAVPVIFELDWAMVGGQTLDLATSGLSAGADSVIHVIDVATGHELAMNDDAVPGASTSRLSYTSATDRWVTIVVRAKNRTTEGTGTLLVGTGLAFPVTLAAPEQLIEGAQPWDELVTVRLPNDGGGRHVAYLMSGQNIVSYSAGDAAGARLLLATVTTQTQRVFAARRSGSPSPMPMRLVRNHTATAPYDYDGDGLGTALEKALGTCDSYAGTATSPAGQTIVCADLADPRDSDGDGLLDGWEVLGRRDSQPPLPLVAWGARPLHKDAFIEIDHAKTTIGEAPWTMTEVNAVKLAAHYADTWRPLTAAEIAAHAADIANPDGSLGIDAHLDIGVAPTDPALATTYGDWGGHDSIPPVNGQPIAIGDALAQHLSPERRGVFRYGLMWVGAGGQTPFGLGVSFSFGNIESPSSAPHELGHAMGLAHSGRPGGKDDVVDVNCKPNYPSFMNYAFDTELKTFSDGQNPILLNNTALTEWAAVNPSQTEFLDDLEGRFGYLVDRTAGHVDWNRDGTFAKAGTTVAAYANYLKGGACEYTRYNASIFDNLTADRGPALTRLVDKLVILAPGKTTAWTATGDTIDCPVGVLPCTYAWQTGSAGLDSRMGVDATPFGAELAVVGRGGDGRLRLARATLWNGFPSFGPPVDVAYSNTEPALATDVDATPLLVYGGYAGQLFMMRWNASGGGAFGAPQPVLDEDGASIAAGKNASPALLLATMRTPSNPTGKRHMFLVVPQGDAGALHFYERDDASGRFVAWAGPMDVESARGKPAMAWVPDNADQLFGGRLTIAYVSGEVPANAGLFRQMWSYAKIDSGVAKHALGLGAYFNNEWYGGGGIDLLYQPGADVHLRAAVTNGAGGDHSRSVQLFPKADGIIDFTYGDWDDWRVLASGLCEGVVSPNQVHCPDHVY